MQPKKSGFQKHVLVVDDEAAIRLVTAHILSAKGYAVTTGIDGIEGQRRILSEEPIDLVITDLTMPGMTGIELARICRNVRPGVPVIFATGSLDCFPEIRADIVCLSKPFTTQQLLDAVERALSGPSGRPFECQARPARSSRADEVRFTEIAT